MTKKIIASIEKATGVSLEEIRSPDRRIKFVYARMILSKIIREKGCSLEHIGRIINRDHSTVCHYFKIYGDELTHNCEFWELDTMTRKELKQ
ncbi:MAG: helix-turn-helix domain-containing protein [Bacteroidales bacterium]